jgi:hypothetical protein
MQALLCLAMLTVGEKPAVDLLDLNLLELSYRLRLERELARLDRDDPGWRFDDLQAARAVVPDDRNLALRLLAIRKQMPANWPQWTKTEVPGIDNPNYFARLNQSHLSKLRLQKRPESRLSHLEIASLDSAVSEAGIQLDAIRQLSRLESGRYPVMRSGFNVMVEGHDEARSIFDLVECGAMLAAESKDTNRLAADLQSMLAVARSFGDDGHYLSVIDRLLHAIATSKAIERALAQTELSEEQLRDLQRRLEVEDAFNPAPHFLQSLRAESELMFAFVESGRWADPAWRKANSLPVAWAKRLPPRVAFWSARQVTMTTIREALEWERKSNRRRFDPPVSDSNGTEYQADFDLFISEGMIRQAIEAIGKKEAHIRTAIAAVAAERFRKAKGRWPKDLAELKPRYLREVPLDPFSNGELRFVPTKDGILIYSVGEEGKDNNGKREYGDRETPSDPAALDVGFGLWNIDARRQPPLPPLKQNMP